MRYGRLIWLVSVLFCLVNISAAVVSAAPNEKLFNSDAKKIVYYVPQFSDFKEISEQDRYFLKKVLRRARRNNVKAVIFELDTPGGRVDTALKYRSILDKAGVPVIIYLNPNGISAGAIIALAADRIAISPNGIIGDAMPIQMGFNGIKPITENPADEQPTENSSNSPDNKKNSGSVAESDKKNTSDKKVGEKMAPTTARKDSAINKRLKKEVKRLQQRLKSQKDSPKQRQAELANQKFLSVFFKSLQVLAEKNHRPVRVIRAMADPYQKLTVAKDGIKHQKLSPLTLSAKEAKRLHVVDYLCSNKEELLQQLGLTDCKLQIITKTPTEQIMSFLSYPAITAILLILGLLGIYVEIRTPGFGVPGVLGVTALTMFFLGHVASGASDWGPMVIFFVGVMLLMLELFVIPGFGIVGILGILCIMISLFGAFGFENIDTAVNVIGISILSAIAIGVLLTIYVLPKSTIFKRIALDTEQNSSAGYSAPHQEDDSLIGKTGQVYSKLRPSGTVMIDGKRYDASADGEFIDEGTTVKVVALNGFQITVKPVNNSSDNASSETV